MKNSQKKFLSAILAASSVAGVVAPVTALAATTTEVQTLVDNALKDKTFYSFNVAYGAILGLPAADQGQYLAQIAPLEAVVRTADIDTVLRQIDKFYDSQDMSIHDNVLYTLIPQVKAQVDRDYLQYELYKWGKVFIEQKQPEYIAATDAIIAVDTELQAGKLSDSVAKVDAASKAITAVAHSANNAYLKTLLAEVQGRLDKALDAVTLTVDSVKATSKDTLVVSGQGLKALTAADVDVEGTEVSSVTVNADRTEATVKLAEALVANADTTVTVKGTDYTVNYSLGADTVSIDEVTFDNNTDKQYLTLRVNGEAVSVEELQAAGYDVEIIAINDDTDEDATEEFFYGTQGDEPSSTTRLNDEEEITIGTYKVQVVLDNGTDIITSEKATIKVRNLDASATSIGAYELTNYGTEEEPVEFEQNSTTLVEGETAAFTEITVGDDDITIDQLTNNDEQQLLEVESSDESVISVADDGTLTAEAPGTAKITLTYGEAVKTITLTVENDEREIAKVKPETTSVKTIIGADLDVDVQVLDQYGDPISADDEDFEIVYTAGAEDYLESLPAKDDSDFAYDEEDDLYTLTLTGGTDNGSTTITFKYDKKTVGTLKVTNSKVNNVDDEKLVVDKDTENQSDDTTLTLGDDDDSAVTFKLAQYNTSGVLNGYADDLAGYTVKFDKDVVTVEGDDTGEYEIASGATFEVEAEDEGSTTLSLYDADGVFVTKITVKVVDDTTEIKSVAWKTTSTVDYKDEKINYKDVLSVTAATEGDDIVKGITLTNSSTHKVRIEAASGILYLDKDGDGTLTEGTDNDDVKVGILTAKVTSSSDFLPGEDLDIDAGYVTLDGDEGTIIFKVSEYDEDADNLAGDTITSKSIKVDVE